MGVEFRLLGEVGATVGGRVADLGSAKQRSVLAVLLVEAGRPVTPGRLVDRVWGESPPNQAMVTLRSYVSRLRTAGVPIQRRTGGYVIETAAVDLHRFRVLLAKARESHNHDLFAEALGLWRGEPFAGVDSPWLATTRDALRAEHLTARLDHHEVLLQRGEHVSLVGELTALADAHPLDERVAHQLITALHLGGRQAEALHRFESARRTLADELGVDPGPALRLLHRTLLTGVGVLPRQLPPAVTGFTGRDAELAELDKARASHDPGGPPLIIAVHGPGGAGKTSLALHWAHRQRFADGEVYLDLRGYGPGEPVDPAIALDVVLRAIGTPPARIPQTLEERSALLRSTLAEREMLLFLDNARDAAQVRPLLPGTRGVVLVTSRSELRGLAVAEGAHRVDLGRLSPDEAFALVRRTVGDRADRAPGAVGELVELCGRLPLALVIAAQHAAEQETPLDRLVQELRSRKDRLDLLSTPDDPAVDPRAVFSWSYQALEPEVAQAFRYLGLHPAPEFGLDVARVVLGSGTATARRLLDRLVSVHLLERDCRGRYRFHDLLMVYAVELLVAEDPKSDVDSAMARILDWYLHATSRARTAAFAPTTLALPPCSLPLPDFTSRAEAMQWHAEHRAILLAAVEYAADWGFDRHCWQLTFVMSQFNFVQRQVDDLLHAAELAVRCAERSGDDRAIAYALKDRAHAHLAAGRDEVGDEWQARALEAAERVGDPALLANVLLAAGRFHLSAGRARDAVRWTRRAVGTAPADSLLRAHALITLASAEIQCGDPVAALEHGDRALTRYRAAGADYYEALALWTLAEAQLDHGAPEVALRHADEALTLFAGVEDEQITPRTLTIKGRIHAALGQSADARQAWRRALVILERTGDPGADDVRALLA